MHYNMKKTKEGIVGGDLFCFLEFVSSFVCLLQGYVGSGSDGVKLGSFNVSWTLNGKLLFCVWWSFDDVGSLARRIANEFNGGVAWKG